MTEVQPIGQATALGITISSILGYLPHIACAISIIYYTILIVKILKDWNKK